MSVSRLFKEPGEWNVPYLTRMLVSRGIGEVRSFGTDENGQLKLELDDYSVFLWCKPEEGLRLTVNKFPPYLGEIFADILNCQPLCLYNLPGGEVYCIEFWFYEPKLRAEWLESLEKAGSISNLQPFLVDHIPKKYIPD